MNGALNALFISLTSCSHHTVCTSCIMYLLVYTHTHQINSFLQQWQTWPILSKCSIALAWSTIRQQQIWCTVCKKWQICVATLGRALLVHPSIRCVNFSLSLSLTHTHTHTHTHMCTDTLGHSFSFSSFSLAYSLTLSLIFSQSILLTDTTVKALSVSN